MFSGSLIALDLATTSGVASGVPGPSGRPRVWSHRIDPAGLGEFLYEWEAYIQRVVETVTPRAGLVVFESPILGPTTALMTARKLMGLTGACARVAHKLGIPCEEGRSNVVTKFFTGRGSFGRGPNARKEKKQAVIDRCAQLGLGAKDDNAADAAALWYWAAATYCGVKDSGRLFDQAESRPTVML